MRWFKHEVGTMDDPDFISMIDEFGDAGYVMFFGLLEIYAKEFKDVDEDGFLDIPLTLARRKLRKNRVKIEKFLHFCQESLKKPRFYYRLNGTRLSYKVPKFIKLASNWTVRQESLPTESLQSDSVSSTAIEVEIEVDKEKVSKDTFVPVQKCPHNDIINTYHNVLPEMTKVKVWDDTAKKWLRTRWKEDKERQDLSWWGNFFAFVRESPFLMGNKIDFQADLRWMVRSQNFTKIINGTYHKETKERALQPTTVHQAQVVEGDQRAKWALQEIENGKDSGESVDPGSDQDVRQLPLPSSQQRTD